MRIYPVLFAVALLLVPLAGAATVGAAPAPTAQVTTTQSGVSVQLSGPAEANYLDQMGELANQTGSDLRENAFLLMDGDREWVVFTDQEVETGSATVEGTVAAPATTSTTGVIFASGVSVSQEGERVALEEVRESPEQYDTQLVTVDANYTQTAYLADSGAVVSQTAGGIVGGATIGTRGEIGGSAADTVLDLSQSNDRLTAAWERARAGNAGVPTTGYGESRWQSSGGATVDVVVLETGGEATFILADVEFDSQTLESVDTITDRGDELAGEVVTVETQAVGSRLSVKESLLQAARCAPESVTTPAGCIPVPVDSAVHSGVLFDSEPSSLSDSVIYAGISNHEQSRAVAPETGSYQVTGRVVEAESLGEGFPDAYALVVYDMERTGDLAVVGGAREQAEALRGEVRAELRAQLNASVGEEPATATPSGEESATPANKTASSAPGESTPESAPEETETAPAEANIVVESATIVNDDIKTGEEFVVEARVTNTGEASGERTIWLSVGGGDVEHKRISLDGGETQTARFTTWVDSTDEQLVEVGGTSAGVVNPESSSVLPSLPVSDKALAIIMGFLGVTLVVSSVALEIFRGFKSWRGGEVSTSELPAILLLGVGSSSLIGSGYIATGQLAPLTLLSGSGLLIVLLLVLLGRAIYRGV